MRIAFHPPRTRIAVILFVATAIAAIITSASSGKTLAHAAATTTSAARTSSVPGTLNVAVPGARTNLYAGIQAGTVNHWIENNVQEGLVRPDGGGKYTPALATSWTQPNPTTYVFDLRQNAKFSTGQLLTAADVVASIEFAQSAKHSPGTSYTLSDLKSVTATGTHQVTLKLTQPQASFLGALSGAGGLWVSPASWLKAHANDIGTPTGLIVGTGPYKVTKFVPSEGVWLTADNTWWGGTPKVKNIVFTFYTDNNAELLAAKSGNIDLALWVMPTEEPEWNDLNGFKVNNAEEASYVGLTFNVKDKPFDNILVRRAIAEAFDRQSFVSNVLKGGDSQVATAITPPISLLSGYSSAGATAALAALPQPTYDLTDAKKLLAQAGFPNGFTTTLEWPNNGPQLGLAAQVLAANLEKIGITVKVSEVPIAQWLSLNSGLNLMWDQVATGDPGEYIEFLAGPGNPSGYSSTQASQLVAKEETDSNAKSRAAEVVALNKLAISSAYIDVPYWWEPVGVAFKNGVALPGYNAATFYGPWAAAVEASN